MASLPDFFKELARWESTIQEIFTPFTHIIPATALAQVRVYQDGTTTWVSSNVAHDRDLVATKFLDEDPLLNTPAKLYAGVYHWSHDRKFPGCEAFYHHRSTVHKIDHGIIIAQHFPDYIRTTCFSGLKELCDLSHIFSEERYLMEHFADFIGQKLSLAFDHMDQYRIPLGAIKQENNQSHVNRLSLEQRKDFLKTMNLGYLFSLSPQEIACIQLLPSGLTYKDIAAKLHLSPRTVEHYLESAKDRLNLSERHQLFKVADDLIKLVKYESS